MQLANPLSYHIQHMHDLIDYSFILDLHVNLGSFFSFVSFLTGYIVKHCNSIFYPV